MINRIHVVKFHGAVNLTRHILFKHLYIAAWGELQWEENIYVGSILCYNGDMDIDVGVLVCTLKGRARG